MNLNDAEGKKGLLTVYQRARMGDLVACEPLYRYLHEKYPDRKFRFFVKPQYEEIVKYTPYFDELVTISGEEEYFEKKKSFPADTVSYEIMLKNGTSAYPPSEKVQYAHPIDYETINILEEICRLANVPILDETPRFYFRDGVPDQGLPEKYVVFHTISDAKNRQWNVENWNRLAELFLKNGIAVVEIGEHSALKLKDASLIDKTGRMDLQAAAKIIQNAMLFIGIESGFGHIANAVGTDAMIVTGARHELRQYERYSGRFGHGDGCLLMRFYGVNPWNLPYEIAAAAVKRFLEGRPFTSEEFRIFCLMEQVKRFQNNPFYRLCRWLSTPFRNMARNYRFHQYRKN